MPTVTVNILNDDLKPVANHMQFLTKYLTFLPENHQIIAVYTTVRFIRE